jgi:LemA protein
MQKRKFIVIAILLGIVIILAIWITATTNAFIRKEENVKEKWAEVQNTYQRRLDLIPNLVNVVKGMSQFEQGTLEKIALARSNAQSAGIGDSISADNYQRQKASQDSLAAAANRLIVVIENYPVLKGTDAYSGLQTQLGGTERRIQIARRDFNAAVADYNKKVRGFPTNILARISGFKPIQGFEADAGTDKAVEIKFK